MLVQTLQEGIPVDVAGQGNLSSALHYGNHASAQKRDHLIGGRLLDDLVAGRVLVLHRELADNNLGLGLSPLAVAEGKDKRRPILGLSYGRGGTDGRSGVNGDTDFSRAPVCDIGTIFARILSRICGMCAKNGGRGADLHLKNGCQGCLSTGSYQVGPGRGVFRIKWTSTSL